MGDYNSTALVRCENVRFRYRNRWALNGITLDLPLGVSGLLGPNGAGKSTLLTILATLRCPHEGRLSFDGKKLKKRSDFKAARSMLGYLPQKAELMATSSTLRNVEYAAWAAGIEPLKCRQAALHSLEIVSLSSMADRRVRTLSGGERQRVGLACAIVHQPKVLLLDEPTVGLDPVQRDLFRRTMRSLGENAAVLVTTHLPDDIPPESSRVVVMDAGRILFDGPTSEFCRDAADSRAVETSYLRLMEGR